MYNSDLPKRAELPSSQQLLRSTTIAVAVAAALLVAVVLPAEYGIDPTGVGARLGLTEMGKIKTSLAAEAAADKLADAQKQTAPVPAPVVPVPAVVQAPAPVETPVASTAKSAAGMRSDEMTVTLKPGQGSEVKMAMNKGAKVTYSWKVNGGLVNHDTHGDPVAGAPGGYHGYGKGRQVGSDAGELVAAFDGNHGWFWRNRGTSDVTVTIKTNGEYQSLKKVL
ncbi:transmembrane anchor protein [Herbaspirillum huttiense]|jgi:hypothetical protein|uniref:Transmembrane anchor protein n=1 Tax=Herbaspirillum aquaticum TaxID=568783 RepID=A0A225SYZ6_9BURK|nr:MULTISPECIES: transmembrane anchor protein [Herbaspirillum]OWY36468.1 transmembrane anchor protein [Herbaspirillum aquaticum]QBP77201.1 transmembrane anchor protein [Herbaspirillum huttiense]